MFLSRKFLVRRFTDNSDNQTGLTLIESVVAIAVIGIAVAVASPIVVLSVATRIQNQRAEQAWRLAQAEIDSIRMLVERGGDYSTEIADYPVTAAANIQATTAPTQFQADLDGTTTNVAKQVSVDTDGDPEFAVQVFRTQGISAGTPPVPIAFELGVRVYDHRAAQPNLGSLATGEARFGLTSGTTGQRNRLPLAEVYTEVLQGEREGAFCEYWTYLSTTASTAGLNCS